MELEQAMLHYTDDSEVCQDPQIVSTWVGTEPVWICRSCSRRMHREAPWWAKEVTCGA